MPPATLVWFSLFLGSFGRWLTTWEVAVVKLVGSALSAPLKVCHHARIHSHKFFQGLAQRGKSSTGWFFSFKLHLIINDRSELLGVRLTPGNVDDRLPVPEMAKGLFGKLFGDRGYISQALRHILKQQGVELITKLSKNMKPKLLNLMDNILLRKRALIETVNDQLKNVCQLEHSRHRSPIKTFVHLIAGLVAFTWQEKRPALSWTREEQEILNAHKQLVCA